MLLTVRSGMSTKGSLAASERSTTDDAIDPIFAFVLASRSALSNEPLEPEAVVFRVLDVFFFFDVFFDPAALLFFLVVFFVVVVFFDEREDADAPVEAFFFTFFLTRTFFFAIA
jgi:hypothetical protein